MFRGGRLPIQRPASAIPLSDGLTGLASLSAAWLLVIAFKPPVLLSACGLLLAATAPMLWRELKRVQKQRVSAEKKVKSPTLWLLGFMVASSPFLLLHLNGFGAGRLAIAWCVAAPAFVVRFTVERLMHRTGNGGAPSLVATWLQQRRLSWDWPTVRLWSLKAFFVPMYAVTLFGLTYAAIVTDATSLRGYLILAVTFAYTIDLAFGLAGYIFASNLLPNLKSTQPSPFGWFVCLACYPPVVTYWQSAENVAQAEIGWPGLLANDPLSVIAALLLPLSLVLYVSATVAFGLRFSNLSNRGVITHGPYRLMKHPAYLAHVLNAWITTLLLLPQSPSALLVPIVFTVLYRLRAVTEERHMSEEPAYRDYVAWIDRHGLLGRAKRWTSIKRGRQVETKVARDRV